MKNLIVKIEMEDGAGAEVIANVLGRLQGFEVTSIGWEEGKSTPAPKSGDPVTDTRSAVRSAITRDGQWKEEDV